MAEIQYVKDTFEEYLSKKDHVAASDIKNFMKSPRTYYYERHKIREGLPERHFAIGSAVHEFIMEPHLFESNYAVEIKVDRRTKKGKAAFEAYMEKTKGKTLLFDNEMEIITNMSAHAKQSRTFMELLEDSYYEISCYTVDEKTGLKVRMRPDIMPKQKSTIVDLKSCLSSMPRKFSRDVYTYDYNISASYYLDFLQRENYIFAAVEKTAPFQTSLFALSDERMAYGRYQYRMGLDLLKWSIDNNYWCDYIEFEVLKDCYLLGDTSDALETIQNSELIKILE